MTLSEIKKATLELSQIEKGELIAFLSDKTSNTENYQLPLDLIEELDRRIESFSNGNEKTISYENVMSEAKAKYGIQS